MFSPVLLLPAVPQTVLAAHSRAVCATKYLARGFHAVTDDLSSASIALGRHRVDGAFETVEDVGLAVPSDLKGLVVIVSAVFAPGHDFSSALLFRSCPSFYSPLLERSFSPGRAGCTCSGSYRLE